MYLNIIVLPLLGSIVAGFFGRKVGVKGAQIITSFNVVVTTILAILAFIEVGFNNIPVTVDLFRWIDSEWFNIMWGFEFDSLTVKFMGLYLEIYAVLVLIQLCKQFILKLYIFRRNHAQRSSFIQTCSAKQPFIIVNSLNNNGNTKSFVNFRTQQRSSYSTLVGIESNDGWWNPAAKDISNIDQTFLEWFAGFTDAEGNFIINSLKNTKLDISKFAFMFKITLHIDDEAVLNLIKNKLGIGGVRYYKNECIFNVTDRKGITLLISIFDKYNLNTTKHLDYLDFKQAFNFYLNRERNLNDGLLPSVKEKVLDLKSKMNTNRINFDRPAGSPIIITKNWLLGFIEGDGSFFIRRSNLSPNFSIEITGTQLPVLLQIKEFLENSLGFDKYSLFKLKNSSIIAVTTKEARNNSRSSVSLIISNISVLNNYFLPLFNETEFLTKKGKDFICFKTICKIIYNGAHRKEDIKNLTLKLANTMNNSRLSTNKEQVEVLHNEEMDLLLNASPTIVRLLDGRVIDISTEKILPKLTSCVYEIISDGASFGDIYLANSLTEAASIVDLYPDTLSRYLDIEVLSLDQAYVKIKAFKVRRVPVFNG